MSTIPRSLTEEQFKRNIYPYLRKAKRGYESKIPLFKIFNYILYKLDSGCKWRNLVIEPDKKAPDKKELSYHAVFYHYSKWSKDGSLEAIFNNSIHEIKDDLDLSAITLDGSHTIAKKGGEKVAYQGRKKAKTTNMLPMGDNKGNILAIVKVMSGNHNDAFELKSTLQNGFKALKQLGLDIKSSIFNADAGFDTKAARKTCFNHGLIPNIPENSRNRKKVKRGPKRFYNKEVYKQRFVAERSFAWMDSFRHILIRFDRLEKHWLGANFIVAALINLRHVI